MKKYNFYNNLFGWITCAIACAVFCMTIEPTASFWDCGEYIATTYKLMVGHPPGAPTFQLTGRLFTLFAGNDLKMVSILVNIMSALMSGFTILFLFWSITALARKILIKTRTEEVPLGKILAIMGAGLVGGLAYTFTDSFWFSAVEGEVYATSSFYTAIVFWLILKWDYAVDTDKYANKWIVLCAFLMGLSIGVHLLNLLAIPAITFVYYFKKYKTTKVGIIKAFLVS
ncbi:MAG: DUF2723 domain-containing protein, partial [Bacteroidota bacterium]|nr:DUF2723 domain-containing protein [Bacteroidota bacterium]